MTRFASHAYDATRFIATYGPRQAITIMWALIGSGAVVEFSNRGRTYVMPNGMSTRYHLLESVEKLRRLSEFVRPNDRVVVDVGAHSGLFSAFSLERAAGAKVLCVEPQTAMAPFIKRNLAPYSNWDLVTAAVSDAPGTSRFYNASSSQESSLVPSTIRSEIQETDVETVTLDQVCAKFEQIDVLKVDVQGAEHLVLKGGQSTIPRVRTLLIEVSLADPQPHDVLRDLVDDFGPWQLVNAVYAGADLAFERRGPSS